MLPGMGPEPSAEAPDAHEGHIKVNHRQLDFAMRAAGWNQAELARRSGLSRAHISRVLRGESGVSSDGMEKLLVAFNNELRFGELRGD